MAARAAIIAVLMTMVCSNVFAATLEVAPTSLQLPVEGGPAVLYITNRGDRGTVVQIEGLNWTQSGNDDVLTASSVLAVSPPMAQIEPGHTQLVRIIVPPAAQQISERAFRLLVSELPDLRIRKKDRVQVLLQFSVPVFAGDEDRHTPDVRWLVRRGENGLMLIAHNAGLRHANLPAFEMVARDGSRLEIAHGGANYLLAGAQRTWPLAVASDDAAYFVAVETRAFEGKTERYALASELR